MATKVHELPPKAAKVLGIGVSTLSLDQVLDVAVARIKRSEWTFVVTADANCLMLALSDPTFKGVLDEAAMVTADGSGVLWALSRQGVTLPGKVSGVEIAERLVSASADHGFKIFFLGSSPGVAEMAAEKMRLKYPGCQIVGARHGYFPASDDLLVAEEIAETKPDILFVAMGMPRQEQFILKTRATIGASFAMGVGGTLDVMSGKMQRAPRIWQRLHLEWLYRTLQNPKKLEKVKKLPAFFWRVLREKR